MWKPHHLAVGLVRVENTCPHPSNIFGEGHDQFFPDGIDGRVGHLCELLPEIVEEVLGFG